MRNAITDITDIKELYKTVLSNRKSGISIQSTLDKIGYNANTFMARITEKQREKLRALKGLSEKRKKEFKKLYLQGWTAQELRKRYFIETRTALEFAKECTPEYTRSFKHHNRLLTSYQVKKILIRYMRYGKGGRWGGGDVTQKELGIEFGVSANTINGICSGRAWKHVFQGFKKKYNTEILSIVPAKLKNE